MSKKLLIVEDSTAIASVIEQIAQDLGYKVTIATNLAEVEKLLQSKNKYFAATVDYGLPDANNGEAIGLVLAHGIASVVMTGRMDEATRQKILESPIIDYIPKENGHAFTYLKRILYWQIANANIAVLVVDDNKETKSHIVELLKRRNFIVHVAGSGEEALEKLDKNSHIKMVITDSVLPDMDGIELTNAIRKQFNREQLSIIGIVSELNTHQSVRFIKNGADDFLKIPYCLEEFYCRIIQNIENLHNIEKIQQAAYTDYLTGLPNRRSFFEEAQQYITDKTENNSQVGLAILDIDFFKKINDNYGHQAGDYILKLLGKYLKKYFNHGLIARIGGEEFVILLTGETQQQIFNCLDYFRKEISLTEITYDKQDLNLSVSIGVVFNAKVNITSQLELADKALYDAKNSGRNKVCITDN